MSVMDIVLVGFGVVYKLFLAMMGKTLQKIITNSYFVKKKYSFNCSRHFYHLPLCGKKLENFKNDMRANPPFDP